MAGTISIEDMRLFAKVAEVKSFTLAAQLLSMPKQSDVRDERLVPLFDDLRVEVGAVLRVSIVIPGGPSADFHPSSFS